jgi:hypothetical protein
MIGKGRSCRSHRIVFAHTANAGLAVAADRKLTI